MYKTPSCELGSIVCDLTEIWWEADTASAPQIAEKYGAAFNADIASTLVGEAPSRGYDLHTTGLAYATKLIGSLVNAQKYDRDQEWHNLFDSSVLTNRESICARGNGLYFKPRRVPNFAPDTFCRLAEDYAGSTTGLLFRIVGDILVPYQPNPGDGYVRLDLRPSKSAYKVGSGNDFQPNTTAYFCPYTEAFFTDCLLAGSDNVSRGELVQIAVDGELVALQKTEGDHTALLVRPAVLNGVRLPAGSVMTHYRSKERGDLFAFGRLSAFIAPDDNVAQREFSAIFEYFSPEDFKITDFSRALEIFKEYSGRR